MTEERAVRERPGRQKAVDLAVVEGMASVGATIAEIADFLGVSEALVRKKARAEIAKGKATLRIKLRRAQVKKALDGNPAMLIWLGKQMLGQTDQRTVTFNDLDKLSDAELEQIAAGKVPDA